MHHTRPDQSLTLNAVPLHLTLSQHTLHVKLTEWCVNKLSTTCISKPLPPPLQVWDIRSVMNILYSLVSRSAINEQLVVYQQGGDPATVAGPFGKCSLYKNLGYFSLIALLRLHCQLGDYYLAMEAVRNVHLSKKV